MMRNDPLLASSFLKVLCGGEGKNRTGKDTTDKIVKSTGTVPRISPTIEMPQPSVRVIEKQRAIRIIAAESLLKEELAKDKPVLASVAAFRKMAYSEESRGNIDQDMGPTTTVKEALVAATDVVTEHATTPTLQTSTPGAAGGNAGDEGNIDLTEGEEIVVSEEEEMSVSESREEGEGVSDGFSRSDGGSSMCGSVTSRGNRKRYAVESPEREPAETTRKEFPGKTTRSEGGCRINVPTRVVEPTTEAGARGVEPTTEVGARGVEPTTEVGARGAEFTTGTGVREDGNTTESGGGGCEATTDPNVTLIERTAGTGVQVITSVVHTAVGSVGTSGGKIDRGEEPTEVLLMALDTAIATDVSLTNVRMATIEVVSEENTTALSTTETAQPLEVLMTRQPLSTGVAGCVNPVIHTATGSAVLLPAATRDSMEVIPVTVSHDVTAVLNPSITADGHLAVISGAVARIPNVASGATAQISASDGWGRDAHMVEGLFQIIEGMEPPWITLNVLEAAALRFPMVDREILRLTIMTVMMTQRRVVVRLTRARLRFGPCVDRE